MSRNPSSGSITANDPSTGSLDRMKAQVERRKKMAEAPNITGRVENTRVNADETINDLFRNSKLEKTVESERKCNK